MALVKIGYNPERVVTAGDTPGVIVNRDLVNPLFIGATASEASNPAASIIDALDGLPVDGSEDIWVCTQSQTILINVDYLNTATGWSPNAVQIAAQIAVQGINVVTNSVDWINVTASPYNADPSGAKDATTAINNAIATGKPVYFPAGTYKSSGITIPAAGNVRLIGDAYAVSQINLSGAINLNVGSQINDIEIDRLTLNATGTDIFGAPSCGRLRVTRCDLLQNSPGFGIMGAPSGAIVEMVFRDNKEEYNGAGNRSVPMWNLVSANQVNQCLWENENCFNNNSADTTQYWWLLSNSAAGGQTHAENNFRNIVMEHQMGGILKQLSCTDTLVEKVVCWDLTSTVTNSLFYVGKNGTNPTTSSGITFRQCNRRGGTFAASQTDIQLESTVTLILIDGCQQQAGGTVYSVNLGSAAGINLRGLNPNTVITNWSDWQFMTTRGYQNSWTDQGTHGSGRFRLTDDNRVEISGFLQSPGVAPGAGQVIINLPTAYTPASARYIRAVLNPGGAAPTLVMFELLTTGNLTIVNAGVANSGYEIEPILLDLGA